MRPARQRFAHSHGKAARAAPHETARQNGAIQPIAPPTGTFRPGITCRATAKQHAVSRHVKAAVAKNRLRKNSNGNCFFFSPRPLGAQAGGEKKERKTATAARFSRPENTKKKEDETGNAPRYGTFYFSPATRVQNRRNPRPQPARTRQTPRLAPSPPLGRKNFARLT
jgi:hypothetical protein